MTNHHAYAINRLQVSVFVSSGVAAPRARAGTAAPSAGRLFTLEIPRFRWLTVLAQEHLIEIEGPQRQPEHHGGYRQNDAPAVD